jgi:peptidyl-prolyl cis-trans isomerase D
MHWTPLSGAKFEDVVKRESADSASLDRGGLYEGVTRGRFVKPFEDVAFALKPGELSQPVLTQYGYHLIRVESRKGDTINVRHLLLRIGQSDSTAAVTNRQADRLEKLAAESSDPRKFDAAASEMGLPVTRLELREAEPATVGGQYVPDVSAWAFGGAKPGETSQLIEAENAYYLARLDSLQPGGETVDAWRDEIHRLLARQKKVELLVPRAQRVADAVARGSTLEQAAAADGLTVQRTPMFTRLTPVPGLGRYSEAIGASFALPVGAVSAPIKTRDGVFLVRVERRVEAERAAWEAQKEQQRAQVTMQLRRQRVQQFLVNLREAARVEDDRQRLRQARGSAA